MFGLRGVLEDRFDELKFVMAGLVPAIHVFSVLSAERRGCPA
jgi:hypothetical protein